MPESISLWLLFAVGLGGLGLLVVSFWRPHWGLALALIASYNPYYVYTKLNAEWWQGAGVRVIISLLFLTTLAMAILLRWLVGVKVAPVYRARTSIDSIGRFYVVF